MGLPFTRAWQVNYFAWLSRFPLTVVPAPDHQSMPQHVHGPCWELVLVAEGRAQHMVGGSAYAIEAGDVLVIPKNVEHGYERCRGLGLVNVIYDPEGLQLPLLDLRQAPGFSKLFELGSRRKARSADVHHFKVDQKTLSLALALSTKLHEEILARRPAFEVVARGCLSNLLVELAREHGGTAKQPLPQDHVRLAPLLDWLEVNYQKPVSVAELARRAHVSRATLERLFQKCFGTSPLNYVLRLRVEKARSLLEDTQLSIPEVAASVGVPEASYFSRMFRRYSGFPPRAYRRRFGRREGPSKLELS